MRSMRQRRAGIPGCGPPGRPLWNAGRVGCRRCTVSGTECRPVYGRKCQMSLSVRWLALHVARCTLEQAKLRRATLWLLQNRRSDGRRLSPAAPRPYTGRHLASLTVHRAASGAADRTRSDIRCHRPYTEGCLARGIPTRRPAWRLRQRRANGRHSTESGISPPLGSTAAEVLMDVDTVVSICGASPVVLPIVGPPR